MSKKTNIVLYCKSFIGDLGRVAVLAESVEKHNVDNIPFYVSCPKADLSTFQRRLPEFVTIVTDEDIVKKNYIQNWTTQQIIKSQFWKLIDTENYLCVDSDSYFIRPFATDDFIVKDSTPYTVMHQQKNLFQWTAKYSSELGFDPQESFNSCRINIGKVFGRDFKVNYDFGPNTVLWSSKVWNSLEKNYLEPNNLTFEQLIDYEASEFTWYGEWLLATKPIEIYPIEPLFLVMHYPQQYTQFKQQGYTEADLAKIYFGVTMTSNWGAPLKY